MPDAPDPATATRRTVVVGDSSLAGDLARSPGNERTTRLLPAADLADGFGRALDELGGVDLVVGVHYEPALLVPRSLTEMSPAEWRGAVGRTLDVVRELTVRSSAPLHESGGQLVFVLPTIAMTGAPGWVPLATAAEATRSWAKSVARQWAAAGVGVSCVATALPLILGDGSADPVPAYIGFSAGIKPSSADVHAAIDALSGPLASHVAGATLTVDGGVHMEP
jgi:NAD(P)-dependent dehydrogenase (short-subunit alcohol dehydrogenase family)